MRRGYFVADCVVCDKEFRVNNGVLTCSAICGTKLQRNPQRYKHKLPKLGRQTIRIKCED